MIKVNAELREKNLKARLHGRKYKTRTSDPELMDTVVRRYNEGECVTEIAKDLGIGRATAYKIIKERS